MVPNGNFERINFDPMNFKANQFGNILPSNCVIMDEITGSSHRVIEHLCSLHVEALWCAGLFDDCRPIPVQKFTAFRLSKIIRCPPIVQSLLKYTEKEVNIDRPYRNDYQNSFLKTNLKRFVNNLNENNRVRDKETSSKDEKQNQSLHSFLSDGYTNPSIISNSNFASNQYQFNIDKQIKDLKSVLLQNWGDEMSLEERLALKFPVKQNKNIKQRDENDKNWTTSKPEKTLINRKDESITKCYIPSSTLMGLPTDGLRPHLIDHQNHIRGKLPLDCQQCGNDLADFLFSMVKPEGFSEAEKSQAPHKNKFALKFTSGRGRGHQSCGGNSSAVNSSGINPSSSSGQKLQNFFDSRALNWSDVIISAWDIDEKCTLYKCLESRGIPVQMVTADSAAKLEDFSENKLFVTKPKDTTGLERALVVFVPSDSDSLDNLSRSSGGKSEQLADLLLGRSVARYSAFDQQALWYVASRSLSSLVLVLP